VVEALASIMERTEVYFGGSDISSVSFLRREEEAEVFASALCHEFATVFANALQPDCVVAWPSDVAIVFAVGSFPEIGPSVVGEVPVGVVNENQWVLTSDHLPYQLVSGVSDVVDADADTSLVFVAGYAASMSHAATYLPTQKASRGVVVEEFEKAGLGWQRSELHSVVISGGCV
jgi:hypothetical protein